MKKPASASGVLLAAFAASALLQGCRTQQPGTPSRRTLFGGPTVSDPEVPAAVVRDAPATRTSRFDGPEAGDVIVPGPMIDTAPTPVPVPPPVSRPAPVTGSSAGADSYRRYMGQGASAPTPAPQPQASHPPAATPPAAPAPSPRVPQPPAPTPDAGAYRIHVVQPGESAGMIANSNGMRLAEFVQLNGIADPNRLMVGQQVRVATGRSALSGASSADPTEGGRYHVVRSGDSLSKIASQHNTSVAELQRLNGLSDPNMIREGQRLLVSGAGAAPHPTAPTVHPTVTPPPPVTPTVPTTTRPIAPPATTRPVVAPPATTRPTVAPPPPPPSADTQPGVVEIGGTQVSSRDLLSPGGSLLDVVAPPATGPAATPDPPAPPVEAAPGTREYVVKDGEDIYSIGLDIGVKPFRIRELNHGRNLEGLKAGDRILVPAQ